MKEREKQESQREWTREREERVCGSARRTKGGEGIKGMRGKGGGGGERIIVLGKNEKRIRGGGGKVNIS